MSDLNDNDPLTRFLTSKKHFAATTGRIHPRAFLPPPGGKLSVYQTAGLDDPMIWELGRKNIPPSEGRRVFARGDLKVRDAQESGLEVDPDEDPPRHANLIGWPPSDKKDEQLEIAKELAKRAKLKLP